MSVRVVTDSTADLAPQLVQMHNIGVVPLTVVFGDEVYKEGLEMTPDVFYERLPGAKPMPTTSAPSVGDFLEVYKEALKTTDEIVSVHLSSKLSATYSAACQAAAQLADEGARIDVIDTQTVSLGIGFMTVAAAKAAAQGASVEEIRRLVESMIPRMHVFVVLDTLEYVRRGGRIGRARAFLGAVMRVKPILSFRGGEVHPEERVRTKSLALERMFQIATSYARATDVGIGYSTNAQEAEELRRRLEAALPGAKIHVARLGPVLGVHGGPGTLGIGVLEGEE